MHDLSELVHCEPDHLDWQLTKSGSNSLKLGKKTGGANFGSWRHKGQGPLENRNHMIYTLSCCILCNKQF